MKLDEIAALDVYLGWKVRQKFSIEPDVPLFINPPNSSKGQRLGYIGVYDLIKNLAKVSELEGTHPRRLRYICATALVMSGMDTMLAKRIVQISFDRIFFKVQ